MAEHTEQARAVARETGWDLDAFATDHEWSAVGLGPVGQHRDSDVLDRTNFAVVLADLQERFGDAVTVASFGHWGVGWVEELAWDVGRADVTDAVQAWRDALDSYPVADDEAYSEAEYEDAIETLTQCYDVPEDRAADVFSWLFDKHSYCSGEDYRQAHVEDALDALGINLDDE